MEEIEDFLSALLSDFNARTGRDVQLNIEGTAPRDSGYAIFALRDISSQESRVLTLYILDVLEPWANAGLPETTPKINEAVQSFWTEGNDELSRTVYVPPKPSELTISSGSEGREEANAGTQLNAKYGITVAVTDIRFFLEISLEEFERIKSAKAKIIRVLGIEEKFDIVLQNYAEYERELLNLRLERMLYNSLDWSGGMADIYIINRRLANLLTVTRLYIDHVKHDVSTIYGSDSESSRAVIQSFSTEYDRSLGYRVMEALRNFLQHRAFPTTLIYPSERDDRSGKVKTRFGIQPQLDLSTVREEGDFKAAVFKEMERGGESLDLTILIRQFIEGLSRVHHSVREIVSGDCEAWKTTMIDVLERVRKPLDGRFLGLAAVKQEASGDYSEKIQIFDDPIKRLNFLVRKNCTTLLGYLSSWYVSSEVR